MFLKPSDPVEFKRRFKRQAFECHTAAEVATHFDEMAEFEPMLQEFVPGSDDELYTLGSYLDADGEALGVFCGRKLRQTRENQGSARVGEAVWVDAVVEDGLGCCGRSSYTGVSQVEFKRDRRTGEFKLMEVNPRLWQWHGLASACGVDLPMIAYLDLIGRPPAPVKMVGRGPPLGDHPDRRHPKRLQRPPYTDAVWAADDPAPALTQAGTDGVQGGPPASPHMVSQVAIRSALVTGSCPSPRPAGRSTRCSRPARPPAKVEYPSPPCPRSERAWKFFADGDPTPRRWFAMVCSTSVTASRHRRKRVLPPVAVGGAAGSLTDQHGRFPAAAALADPATPAWMRWRGSFAPPSGLHQHQRQFTVALTHDVDSPWRWYGRRAYHGSRLRGPSERRSIAGSATSVPSWPACCRHRFTGCDPPTPTGRSSGSRRSNAPTAAAPPTSS